MVENIQSVTSYEPILQVTGNDKQAGQRFQKPSSDVGKQAKEISKKDMKEVVQELNKAMQLVGTNLAFSIDDATQKTVVKVLNAETHEIIRQIPSEDMLRVSRRITELLGILFDHSA